MADFLLSVIVPIYNVKEFLEACLESIVAQEARGMEVILVDDGSTDGSSRIAQSYADKYPHWTCYHIENAGLGHARNFGAERANGAFLTFPDSDDIVPDHAYAHMLDLALRRGSDMVIGDVVRFNSKGEYKSSLHRKALDSLSSEEVHITRDESLIYDTTAWNKLYRADFYRDNNLRWPEGMLYEDIPVTVPAHFKANKVAYLNEVVYCWRGRDGVRKSITQRRTDQKNFLDRLKAIRMVDDFYDNNVDCRALHVVKDFKWLSLDLMLYINTIYDADDEYARLVFDEISSYLQRVNQCAFEKLNALDRAKYECIREGNLSGLKQVVHYCKRGKKTLKVAKSGSRLMARFPFDKDVPIDCDVTREICESGLTVSVKKVNFTDSAIHVEGECFPRQLNVAVSRDVILSGELFDRNGNSIGIVPVKVVPAPQNPNRINVSRDFRKLLFRRQRYRRFELDVPFDLLSNAGLYQVRLRYSWRGLEFAPKLLANPAKGLGPRPRARRTENGVLSIEYPTDYSLSIRLSNSNEEVREISLVSGNIIGLRLTSGDTIRVSVRNLTNKPSLYSEDLIYLQEPRILQTDEGVVVASESIGGLLTLRRLECCAIVGSLGESNNAITFETELVCAPDSPTQEVGVLLRGRQHGVEYKVSCLSKKEASFFKAVVKESTLAEMLSDTYGVVVELNGIEIPVVAVEQFADKTLGFSSGGYRYEWIQDYRRPLVRVKRIKKFYEKTKFRRKLVERCLYPAMRVLPLNHKLCVFESYWGNSIGCNPFALYEYLDNQKQGYDCVWFVKDERTPLSGGGRKVRRGSLAYYYVLSRASYFINNVNFGDEYVKRPGQVEIQTMHGTPLKTLGLDVEADFPTERVRQKFLRRCSRWDYLIVQSPVVEEITKSCYAYRKQYLRTGYPRNDKLFRGNNPQDIEKIKRRLGLDSGKKVVLYAPTWRVRGKFDLQLDLNRLCRDLGDRYTFCLRLHHISLDGFDTSTLNLGAGVVDVSHVDSIDDLMLVTDVLITDYSSLMFDYALLGRPMIFFAYDLEDYRDSLRGFNIDLETEAPGPLVKTTDEVEAVLRHLSDFNGRYGNDYERFVKTYLPYEHGDACERVFNAVFKS